MNNYPYVIIDDDQSFHAEIRNLLSGFQSFAHVGSAENFDTGIDLILETSPKLVFLEIDPVDPESRLSLNLISELYRYLKEIPKIVIVTKNKDLAISALKYEIFDFIAKPVHRGEFIKAILKFERAFPKISDGNGDAASRPFVSSHTEAFRPFENVPAEDFSINGKGDEVNEVSDADDTVVNDSETETLPIINEEQSAGQFNSASVKSEEKPLIICVKSYGDYRFINADDIAYLKADNNSTDIHLSNGEMITAFKTLKHFESVLRSPFVRIHNSYIVNIDYVSRIHTGNAVCYLKNSTIKLPFSKSYKENIDSILQNITKGNYLEI